MVRPRMMNDDIARTSRSRATRWCTSPCSPARQHSGDGRAGSKHEGDLPTRRSSLVHPSTRPPGAAASAATQHPSVSWGAGDGSCAADVLETVQEHGGSTPPMGETTVATRLRVPPSLLLPPIASAALFRQTQPHVSTSAVNLSGCSPNPVARGGSSCRFVDDVSGHSGRHRRIIAALLSPRNSKPRTILRLE
jgi:hypothetical protein